MAGWVAAAVVGSAAVGYLGSQKASQAQQSAASQASDVAAQTASEQVALQREIFEKQTELQKPFREAGLAGQNRLMELLGIGGTKGAPGYGKYASAEFGGVKGFDPASLMQGFTAKDFQADPGYAFRMSEGMKALERSAAARGGLLSGATLRGTQRYGQDLASQEYQNAFNRFQANRASQGQEYGNAFNRYQAERAGTLNPYQALAGTAQSSANTVGQQAGQMGANISNALGAYGSAAQGNIIGSGNAQASGYMGGANAIAGGVGQGINFYQNQQLLNRLPNYGATTGPTLLAG
jgi:hypothetical protein